MPKAGARPPAAMPVPTAPQAPTSTPQPQQLPLPSTESAIPPAMPVPNEDLATRMNQMMAGGNGAPAPSGAVQADPAVAANIMGALQKTNWNDVQGQQFRLLDPSIEYEAELKKVTPCKSSTGSDMIRLEMDVIFPLEYEGIKLFDQCVLLETSLWKMKSLIESCDLIGPDGGFIGESLQELVGYAVRLSIKHDTYNGTTRNKVAGGYARAYEAPSLEDDAAAAPAEGWVMPATE